MEDTLDPQEMLSTALRHSTRIKDIEIDLCSQTLPSGFSAIDHYEYLPRNKGRLVVIAGLPGSGKTALALQLASSISKEERVLFFSFEMSKEVLKQRHLSVISAVPLKKLKQMDRAKEYLLEQEEYKLDIIDDSDLTIQQIISKTIDEWNREPIAAIFVDYYGLVKIEGFSRVLGLDDVAKKLKFALADELQIPVVLLAQMNGEFGNRYNQFLLTDSKAKMYPNYTPIANPVRPVGGDIAECKNLVSSLDTLLFLHRPHLFDKAEPASKTTVFVAKHRHGEAKDFELSFSGELTKFSDGGW